MAEFIFAEQNGRKIPAEDKIFKINGQAKAAMAVKGEENVITATLGALYDENGKMVVLSSVVDVLKNLAPTDYAEYAPICGTPAFREAVKKAAFGSYELDCYAEAVASPGGTGAIRNTISNFSKPGDVVLTSDWHWPAYNNIAQEQGRSLTTFELTNAEGGFNIADFKEKASALIEKQGSLIAIINSPAHNPTGYSLTTDEWQQLVDAAKEMTADGKKKMTILVDAAYIDFAGERDEVRKFLPILTGLPENILPLMAYSMSKTFTLYGMRGGALICMAPTKEIAEEFRRVCEYSSRASWSNCSRPAQMVLSKIYDDPALMEKVDAERREAREMLHRRGKAFEEEAAKVGLKMVPFDSGFFASVPYADPDTLAAKLQEYDVFLIPFAKGIRVSLAGISEAACRKIPALIVKAMKELDK